MLLTNGNHDTFSVMVVGGATEEQVREALVNHFGTDKVAVKTDTNIYEVNKDFVLETLQYMGLLSQMTGEQRNRAYELVKEQCEIPEEVTTHIIAIINDNWTDIVFGGE